MPSPLSRVAPAAVGLLLAAGPASAQDSVDPWAPASSSAPSPPPPPSPPPASGSDTVNPWNAPSPAPPPEPPTRTMTIGKKKPPPPRASKRAARPAPKAKRPKGARAPGGEATLASPIFSMQPAGSSRVAVEVNRKVPISEHKAEGRLTFRFKGVELPDRTGMMALPTGFFATPVGRIQLVDQGGGEADLIIELREPCEPVHRLLDTPRGIVLQIDFPPPATPDARAPRNAAAAGPPPPVKRSKDTRRIGGSDVGSD
jgi:hypothetical protein